MSKIIGWVMVGLPVAAILCYVVWGLVPKNAEEARDAGAIFVICGYVLLAIYLIS